MNDTPRYPRNTMTKAVLRRDPAFDGLFFVGVTSTGIFCRPVCPSRKPLPRNMEFFCSARAAIFAGFRPCLRCRPMEAAGTPPAWAAKLLAAVEGEPGRRLRDRDVRAMGIDPARARRWFLKQYGMTFQAYGRGRRMARALRRIGQGAPLEDVILENGYESHSGFRTRFGKTFGKPPGRSRLDDCIVTALIPSPLGTMVGAATSRGICLLEFTDRRALEKELRDLKRLLRCTVVPGNNPHLELLRRELAAYFEGKLTRFTVPLVAPATPFQEQVWGALRRIPCGATLSYEELARAAGRPGAARAAGSANGQNRISIVIPCHRVINKDGRLGGYGGGLPRKQALLELERRSAPDQGRPLRRSAAAGDSGARESSSWTSKTPRSPSSSLR